jgi:hypothetical protein
MGRLRVGFDPILLRMLGREDELEKNVELLSRLGAGLYNVPVRGRALRNALTDCFV